MCKCTWPFRNDPHVWRTDFFHVEVKVTVLFPWGFNKIVPCLYFLLANQRCIKERLGDQALRYLVVIFGIIFCFVLHNQWIRREHKSNKWIVTSGVFLSFEPNGHNFIYHTEFMLSLLVSNFVLRFLAWSKFLVDKLALVSQSSVFKCWTVLAPWI